jgi:two-component system response regulator CpxR
VARRRHPTVRRTALAAGAARADDARLAMQPLCLIVSPDAAAATDWRRGLEPWGFRPYAVPDADAALGVLGQCRFDAVLVDGDAAPGAPAPLAALAAIRARTPAPILVVWSERGDASQIDALDRGAAATAVKPASPRLLGATLKRLVELARAPADDGASEAAGPPDATPAAASGTEPVVAFGPLRLDAGRALATCGGRPMPLTAGEFELVALLARRAGEVVSREALVRSLASPGTGPGDAAAAGRAGGREAHRSVDMHVCRIRRKLDAAGAVAHGVRLATVHGRGYAFRVGADG